MACARRRPLSIDIHATSGHLPRESVSPALNPRTDEYGGSFDNRLRLLREVIAAVRAAVGQDITVGVRIPNEDHVSGGIDAALVDDPLGVETEANRPIKRAVTDP